MSDNPKRSHVIEALHSLEHGLQHARRGDVDHACRPLEMARRRLKEAMLLDVVVASTCAEPDESAAGNIIVGVTAHCQCGHIFCADVRAAASRLLRESYVEGYEKPRRCDGDS